MYFNDNEINVNIPNFCPPVYYDAILNFEAFPTLFAIKSNAYFLAHHSLITANHSTPCPYLCGQFLYCGLIPSMPHIVLPKSNQLSHTKINSTEHIMPSYLKIKQFIHFDRGIKFVKISRTGNAFAFRFKLYELNSFRGF